MTYNSWVMIISVMWLNTGGVLIGALSAARRAAAACSGLDDDNVLWCMHVIYIYMYTYIYIYTCIYVYIHIHRNISIFGVRQFALPLLVVIGRRYCPVMSVYHIYVYLNTYIYIYLHIYICIYIHIHTHVSTPWVQLYAYIHIYIYIYSYK